MDKLYTSQELNEYLGYSGAPTTLSGKEDLLIRCKNAGLIVEDQKTKRGVPNLYKIIEDNFYIEGEVWKDCYCQKDWEVSNLGRVRKKSTKKLLGFNDQTGYVALCGVGENGKTKRYMAHRLIYFSFHPEHLEHSKTYKIDHINGKRDDNRLENLRLVATVENTNYRDRHQQGIKTLTTEIILKVGYEETEKILLDILEKL